MHQDNGWVIQSLLGLTALFLASSSHAALPWTLIPVSGFPPTVAVASGGTATIQYTLTNQSPKSHTLVMTPINGIIQDTTAQGNCANVSTLGFQQSCILSLTVNANALQSAITTGPVVCQQNSLYQCYQPTPENRLNITVDNTLAGISENPATLTLTAQSGVPGSIAITNNSSNITATNITATLPTIWTDVVQNASACVSLAPGNTCQLTFTPGSTSYSAASVPIQGTNTSQVTATISVAPMATTTLTSSLSTLALSVSDTSLNAALTGNPRQLIITNTGTAAATNVTYSLSPALPSGTTVSPATCGTIQPSSTCILTVTPGATASSAATTLTAQGTNTNTLAPAIYVLTYGSIYEGGYVFSVDDTYGDFPESQSIGGKVAALTDQVSSGTGILWSSNSSGTYDGGISIWGIDETSTVSVPSPNASTGSPNTALFEPGQANCIGTTQGACNAANIIAYYSPPTTSPAIPSADYAEGLCANTIDGFTSWYLPAICEEGYDTLSAGTGCGSSGSPLIQNMQSNLFDTGNVAALSGQYWSSTEYSASQFSNAWTQTFITGGAQSNVIKSTTLGVRCVRALTP